MQSLGVADTSLPQQFLRGDLVSQRPYCAQRPDCPVRLDANESPFDVPEDVRAEIADAVARMPLNRYPDGPATALREALAEHSGLPAQWVAVGNGSDELIAYLVQVFRRPGTCVVSPEPTFSMYGILARALGAQYIGVPLLDTFALDDGALRAAIPPHGTHLVFLAYPNNPTGNCWDEDAILRLLDVPNALVIVDEAYYEYSGRTLLPLVRAVENLVVLRTFSKAYGAAGLRVGWMAARPGWVDCVDRVRLPYNVNSLSQAAALVLLRRTARMALGVQAVVAERRRVAAALASRPGTRPFPSDANFVLFRAQEGAERLWRSLVRQGVLVRNLHGPGLLENCLRVTIGTADENDAFLQAMDVGGQARPCAGETAPDG